MKIAALQMQAINGDITANLARIAAAAKDAAGQGAKLLIAPELAVTGYGAGGVNEEWRDHVVLQKPFEIAEFAAAIKRAMH